MFQENNLGNPKLTKHLKKLSYWDLINHCSRTAESRSHLTTPVPDSVARTMQPYGAFDARGNRVDKP